ncbi:MAG: hypothetical protein K0R39_5073, partial [Symbiobacteriaceae bacterium]|jgi:hypothetical protein|nr:hypothetical protein [Symbiobacteriaceae bacterium]
MLNVPAAKQSIYQKYSGFMQSITDATQKVDDVKVMAGTLATALQSALNPTSPGAVATKVAMQHGASGQIGGAYAMAAALQARVNSAQAGGSTLSQGGAVPVIFSGGPLKVVIVEDQTKSWIDSLKPVGFAAAGGAFIGNLIGGVAGAFVNPLAYIKMFEAGTELLKSLERLMPQFFSFIDGPLNTMFDKLLTGAQYVQNFLDSAMGYLSWLITGFGDSGWITKSVLGFFDAALLWATSRVTALLDWASRTLQSVNQWLFSTISVMVENLFNTVVDTIINTVISRLLNFIRRAWGELWGAIRGIQAGMSAFGSWTGSLFANIMANIHNAIASGVNAMAGPINAMLRAKAWISDTPYVPMSPMATKAVPQVASLDFIDAMTRGHTQGLNEARSVFPWNLNSQTVKQTALQPWLPSQGLQTPPAMGRLPKLALPGLSLPGAAQPGQGDGSGGSVTVQGGIHITVQAAAVNADNLDMLARELAERMMEELERVGNMRLSRQGRPLLAPQ